MPLIRASKHEGKTELKGKIDQSTIIVGNFQFSQEKKTENQYGYFNQFKLNDIYKPLHPTTVECIVFSSTQGILKIHRVLGQKSEAHPQGIQNNVFRPRGSSIFTQKVICAKECLHSASSTDLACEGRHTPEEGTSATRTAGAAPRPPAAAASGERPSRARGGGSRGWRPGAGPWRRLSGQQTVKEDFMNCAGR